MGDSLKTKNGMKIHVTIGCVKIIKNALNIMDSNRVVLTGQGFFYFFELIIGSDPLFRLLIVALLFDVFFECFNC